MSFSMQPHSSHNVIGEIISPSAVCDSHIHIYYSSGMEIAFLKAVSLSDVHPSLAQCRFCQITTSCIYHMPTTAGEAARMVAASGSSTTNFTASIA